MATSAETRTVSAPAKSASPVDIKSLVLLAILLAAGFILNMTLGNALGIVGIKPQFIIAAYALTIILTRANLLQAAIYAIVSAAVIQLTTSITGLNFVTDLIAALLMSALVKANTVLMGAELATAVVKVPIVLGTAVFNAIVVQALYFPLKKVLGN